MKNLIYILFIFLFIQCSAQKKKINEPIEEPIELNFIKTKHDNRISFCDTINGKAIAILILTINNNLKIVKTNLTSIRFKAIKDSSFKLYKDTNTKKFSQYFQNDLFLKKAKILLKNKNFNDFPYRAKIYIPFELKKCKDDVVN